MSRSSVTRASSCFSRLISVDWSSLAAPTSGYAYRFVQAYNEWVLAPRRCETSATYCPRSVIYLTASVLKSSVNRGWPIIVSLPNFKGQSVCKSRGYSLHFRSLEIFEVLLRSYMSICDLIGHGLCLVGIWHCGKHREGRLEREALPGYTSQNYEIRHVLFDVLLWEGDIQRINRQRLSVVRKMNEIPIPGFGSVINEGPDLDRQEPRTGIDKLHRISRRFVFSQQELQASIAHSVHHLITQSETYATFVDGMPDRGVCTVGCVGRRSRNLVRCLIRPEPPLCFVGQRFE